MGWTHKGVGIEIDGSQFTATFDGVRIIRSSLAAVQKDIEKRMDAKARQVTLDLPVVVLRISRWGEAEPPFRVDRATITGINDLDCVTGISEVEGYTTTKILPASDENAKLLADWRASKEETDRLQELVIERSMPMGFSKKTPYAECIATLQKLHAAK